MKIRLLFQILHLFPLFTCFVYAEEVGAHRALKAKSMKWAMMGSWKTTYKMASNQYMKHKGKYPKQYYYLKMVKGTKTAKGMIRGTYPKMKYMKYKYKGGYFRRKYNMYKGKGMSGKKMKMGSKKYSRKYKYPYRKTPNIFKKSTPSPTIMITSMPNIGTPTRMPTTQSPVAVPTTQPATADNPTFVPTASPTLQPNAVDSTPGPTEADATSLPTAAPTTSPTTSPTTNPTSQPATVEGVYGLQPDCGTFDDSRFNICLDITSDSGEVESWFPLLIAAKERWERIITVDRWGPFSQAFLSSIPEGTLTPATGYPTGGVDDIYVAVKVGDLGGLGGRYAEAGQVSSGSNIVAGEIVIDRNDIETALNEEIFEGLMLHELGHVLGLGTLWGSNGLNSGTTYTGSNAVQAWNEDVNCEGDGLPLETDQSHWDEDCLGNELMTPVLRFKQDWIVSSVTMGALEDLGYTVNRGEQDPFGISDLGDCGSFCPAAARRLDAPGTSRKEQPVRLSAEAELLLKQEADIFFGNQDFDTRRMVGKTDFTRDSVAYLYEENGAYFSRVFHRM